MGCGCNKKKNTNATRVKAYRNKHLGLKSVNINKPKKSKEQLRKELIDRIRKNAKK